MLLYTDADYIAKKLPGFWGPASYSKLSFICHFSLAAVSA